MAVIGPKIEGAAIVFLGAFNPAILQPHWLASMGLIRSEKADAASVDVISPQVASFSLDWASIQVLQGKFVAQSLDAAHHAHILALATGIFAKLEDTPFSKMGLIRRAHYELPSEEEWHRLGDLLVPKDLWSEVITSPIREGTPGLRTLVVEGSREGSSAQWLRVKVEPSTHVPHGIYVESHEQYDESELGDEAGRAILDMLRSNWDGFLSDAEHVADAVLSWVEK